MSNITAADVAKLRKSTGAGMMDCKKALQEADGNFDQAIKIIRKKGQAIANKRADRDAGEGVVIAKVSSDNKHGAILALNCETDFVAKNDDFIKLAYQFLDAALEAKPASLEDLKKVAFDGTTIGERVIENIGVVGEKQEISYYESLDAEYVQSYIHPGNMLATLVAYTKDGLDPQVYKDVAMQVAAMNPEAVDKENVSQEVIDRELEIGMAQARREGKPDKLIEKIAQGKLAKFFKENTLLNQEFVKDNKQTIKQYLLSIDKELSVSHFKRFTLNG